MMYDFLSKCLLCYSFSTFAKFFRNCFFLNPGIGKECFDLNSPTTAKNEFTIYIIYQIMKKVKVYPSDELDKICCK